MGLTDFRPLVRVVVNGIPISDLAFSQLSSVRVSDSAGFVSDSVEITFANVSPFGYFAMPEPGAEIEVSLGYLLGFRTMGVFVADEVEESGPPRSISILGRAKAQGATSSGMGPIQQQKSRSWDAGLTLSSIASTIASENGLIPAIAEAAGSIVPGHIDQIDESDIAVLTRIALAHDLIAKPAGRHLFVGRRADALTASGAAMPTALIKQSDVSSWRIRQSLGETVGSVIATYRDLDAARDVEVTAGEGEPVRRLRGRYADESVARSVADAEARRAGRAVSALGLELPGNPSLIAESKIAALGFSSAADGLWVIDNAVHEVSSAGFKTSIQAQRPSA